jgi:hypothetical protein
LVADTRRYACEGSKRKEKPQVKWGTKNGYEQPSLDPLKAKRALLLCAGTVRLTFGERSGYVGLQQIPDDQDIDSKPDDQAWENR